MSIFEVKVLQIRDSSFNIGFRTGKIIQNNPIIRALEMITKPEIEYENMKSIYLSFAPHLLDELQGLSEGLGISLNKAASLFSGYDVQKTEAMGCSTILTKDYYVRNYDFGPSLYDGNFSLVQPDHAFASAGYNLQAIGRHDGVNEQGVVLGLHFVSNKDYSVGLSPWTSIRMILDTCSTTDDAIQMLKEIPHSACYNFSIGDRNGDIAVVEATPTKISVRREPDFLSCVNHFQVKELQPNNRMLNDNSIKRNDYLQSLRKSNLTYREMFNQFSTSESPLFLTDYDQLFGTLHTFSYSFKDEKILTSIAKGEQIIDINLQEWIQGNNLKETKLTGKIEN
ncbi:C45 family autoproteolytic acyltransferase/hydolase [Rummeliibacillus pycnus]|uniref:C45 family autoproteolytic acyltransferase/hydolase n=1 Tax=Rummeliibacillus pycnus TaxID=101070 RepID=UPI000C9BC92B|nr:C45 family peptidase [Rummeliibacillus pycnus]